MILYRVTAYAEDGQVYNHQYSSPDTSTLYPYTNPTWFWNYLFEHLVKDMLKVMGDDLRADWLGSVEEFELEYETLRKIENEEEQW